MVPLGSCIGSAYEFFIQRLKCCIPLHEPIFCRFNFFHCANMEVLATVKVLALSSDIWSVVFQCTEPYFAKCFAHTIFSLLQRRIFCHWPDSSGGQQTRERLEPWDQGWIIFWLPGFSSRQRPDDQHCLSSRRTSRRINDWVNGWHSWTRITFSVNSYLLEGDGLETNAASLSLHGIAGIKSDIGMFLGYELGLIQSTTCHNSVHNKLGAHRHPMLQEWL